MPTPPSPAWLRPAPSSSAPGPPKRPPATPSLSTLRVRGCRGTGGGRGAGGCQLRTFPLSCSPRGREGDPGHLGAPHLQVGPVAGSVRHQLGRQTGGGCIWGGMWAALGGGGVGTQPVPSPCPGLCPAAALERDGRAARGVPYPDGRLLRAEPGTAELGVVLALPRPDHGQHLPPDQLR